MGGLRGERGQRDSWTCSAQGAAPELIFPERAAELLLGWAGPGLAGDGNVLGRHCLSAAMVLHRSLQYSEPTELPQRKSHFVTKKPFDLPHL